MTARTILNGKTKVLYSYETPVVVIDNGNITVSSNWNISQTTKKQVAAFIGENAGEVTAAIKTGTIKVVEQKVPKMKKMKTRNTIPDTPNYDNVSLKELFGALDEELKALEAASQDVDGKNIWER